MATEVYTTEIVRLLDETEVELRPLPISKLRKFMRIWSEHVADMQQKVQAVENGDATEFKEADLSDAQFDVFIKLCSFGLESQLKGERTDKQFLSYLEDVLDEKTIYRILDRTGGLNLSGENPNQNPAATGLAGAGTV